MKLTNRRIMAHLLFLLIAVTLPCHGFATDEQLSSGHSSGSFAYPALKSEIDRIIFRELLPYSQTSVKVVSLKNGSTIYETNPYQLMTSASLQKLFTAAASLSYLGPAHTVKTSISLNSANNTLYLMGCGDSLLKTSDLKRIAREIAAKLTPGRSYKLVGDVGCFDDKYWGNGWMWDDEPDPDAMFLSPLSVNGNTVTVTAAPGRDESAGIEITLEPPTQYVVIKNIEKKKKGNPCSVTIKRAPGNRDNQITVSGTPAPGCPPVSRQLSVWRPEMYTLTLLSEILKQSGIKVTSIATGVTPGDAKKLALVHHPVADIVSLMLKNSDNLSAENMLKYLAHYMTGQKGAAGDGVEVIRDYLRINRIPDENLVFADGSGLSRYNMTTADAVTRLLVAAYRDQAISAGFISALPIAGKDGTLETRMKGSAAEGKTKAKTGTLRGVSSLAGYTSTADGEPLAFAIMMQNFAGSHQRIRDIQDRIALLLSRLSAAKTEK